MCCCPVPIHCLFLQIAAPRIMFVGGQKLSSTGSLEASKEPLKMYPPGAPATAAVETGEEQEPMEVDGDSIPRGGGETAEEVDPDPVGESRQ